MNVTEDQTGTTTQSDVKLRLLEAIETLAEEALVEVAAFVEYQRYKLEHREVETGQEDPPFEPAALGGLWEGVHITEADIAEARKDMWSNFGDRGF